MLMFTPILAYLGPETMLPMTSVIAGAAGVFMMFGRNLTRWATGLFRRAAVSPGTKPTPTVRRIGQGPVSRPVSDRVAK